MDACVCSCPALPCARRPAVQPQRRRHAWRSSPGALCGTLHAVALQNMSLEHCVVKHRNGPLPAIVAQEFPCAMVYAADAYPRPPRHLVTWELLHSADIRVGSRCVLLGKEDAPWQATMADAVHRPFPSGPARVAISDPGLACAQHARIAGSGCVSSSDLEAAWPAAIAGRLRALVLDDCVRPDGRGLRDVRPLRQEARRRHMGLGCLSQGTYGSKRARLRYMRPLRQEARARLLVGGPLHLQGPKCVAVSAQCNHWGVFLRHAPQEACSRLRVCSPALGMSWAALVGSAAQSVCTAC